MRAILLIVLLLLAAPPAMAQRCSSFRTCEEAMESLRQGNTKIDGDRDGIPCEKLCGHGGSLPAGPRPATPSRRSSAPAPLQLVRQPVSLVSVGDGDTIRISTRDGSRFTIRLACIDTPEMAQGASGKAAREALMAMVHPGSLEIKPQTIDRYGRTVAEVFAAGRNLNLELVRTGKAFVYRQYLAQCDQAAYLGAEATAKRSNLGVWREGVIPPWEFRQGRRSGV